MGTWGYGIKDNDTSFDVIETFFEKYNKGMKPDAIHKDIIEQFAYSLSDDEDRDNVLFPLAQCLWEVCALEDDLFSKIRENIERGNNITICRMLGADEDFLKNRSAMLDKFLKKISTPKEKPKARKKPPQKIESAFHAGSCLAFQYPDGKFGGVVVIEAEFYNTKGSICIALTNIRNKKAPTLDDFIGARLKDFEWEMVYGQAERRAAISKEGGEYYTGRIHEHNLEYDKKQEREAFMSDLEDHFLIVGELPKFTQILCSTTWIDDVSDAPYTLDYYYHLPDRPLSELTLGELSKLLSERAV